MTNAYGVKGIINFDPHLLMTTLQRYMYSVTKEIVPYSQRKIRPQDTKKRKIFDQLLKEFQDLHEWKTIEEAEYKAKIEEESKKRPHFPLIGSTIRFKRLSS